MKTRELIRRLQEEDPSGEIECCVGNVDIYFVSREPAFWDGTLQVLTRDPAKDGKCYSITGGKYVRNGEKVVIKTLSLTDAISNHPDAVIDYSELDPERAESYRKSDDDTRRVILDIERSGERDQFVRWARAKADAIGGNLENLDEEARAWCDENLSRRTPFPAGFSMSGHSYNSARHAQWDAEIEIEFKDMEWKFTRRSAKIG